MRTTLLFCCCLWGMFSAAQTAPETPLPVALDTLRPALALDHFPTHVYATEDTDRKDFAYFWKHITSVMSPSRTVEAVECGAYLFYNDQWNLRVRYDRRDFAQFFNCSGGRLKQGQPYTFVDNWRTDNRLYGGWALWYVIAVTPEGERVFGAAPVYTAGELYPE